NHSRFELTSRNWRMLRHPAQNSPIGGTVVFTPCFTPLYRQTSAIWLPQGQVACHNSIRQTAGATAVVCSQLFLGWHAKQSNATRTAPCRTPKQQFCGIKPTQC